MKMIASHERSLIANGVATRALAVLAMVAPTMKGDDLAKGDGERRGSSNEGRWWSWW